jgi:nucleotide-binding universal stress UspA family protein
MFNRFIVTTDLSSASYALVNCLAGLKTYGAENCLLLLCLSTQESTSIALSYTDSTDKLEAILQEQKGILEKQGFNVESRIVSGHAKKEVNRIAVDEDYSLIVVGSQGHSLVDEALLGGVAYGIINKARKPVLLIPIEEKHGIGKVCAAADGCTLGDHILFPTDFSENADLAFTFIEQLASKAACKITILHVQDKTRIEPYLVNRLEEFNRIDTERMVELQKLLRDKSNAEIVIELRYGHPFVEIMNIIEAQKVNLVVMGSQGRGFIKEIFLGSISHNVARHSKSPLLLIPASEQDNKTT